MRPLLVEQVGPRLALRLVGLVDLLAARPARVPGDDHGRRRVVDRGSWPSSRRSRRSRWSAARRRSRSTPAARRTPGRRGCCRRSGRARRRCRRRSLAFFVPCHRSILDRARLRPRRRMLAARLRMIRVRPMASRLAPSSRSPCASSSTRARSRSGKLTAAIAEAGGALQGVDLVPGAGGEGKRVREFTIDARDQEHWEQILRAIGSTRGARVLDYVDRTLADAPRRQDRAAQQVPAEDPRRPLDGLHARASPASARRSPTTARRPSSSRSRRTPSRSSPTARAVLGLGDIGPEAAMPVMEGKAMLFKEFADVDAFPICLDTNDPDEIIEAVELIAPTFGGINLEDISAPRCFEIEDRAQGGARHPRLPRRPARHRGGDDGGALQRAEDRRQADRGPARADGRPRRRRGRGDEDDARLRGHRRSSAATARARSRPTRDDYESAR